MSFRYPVLLVRIDSRNTQDSPKSVEDRCSEKESNIKQSQFLVRKDTWQVQHFYHSVDVSHCEIVNQSK